MRREVRLPGLAAAGLLWLGLFALLFTIGGPLHVWPVAPEGGFHGTDLVAGLLFGATLLVHLVASRRPQAPGFRLR